MSQIKTFGIEGMPDAGKTSYGRALTRILRSQDVKAVFIEDRITSAPPRYKTEIDRNLWTIRNLPDLILQAREGDDVDVILVEATWPTRISSLKAFSRDERFTKTKAAIEKVERGIQMVELDLIKYIDFFILIEIDSWETSIRRDKEETFGIDEDGVIFNKRFLKILWEVFEKSKEEWKSRFGRKIRIISGEDNPDNPDLEKENLEKLIKFILSSMNHKNGNPEAK